MATPTHALVHRYAPGTGPQEGTAELDAEMKIWAQIDSDLRSSGQLVEAWALNSATAALGTAADDAGSQVVFAVHAIAVESDAAAQQIAAGMPHLGYGSTTVHPLMR
ncbi:hypothetical protein [Sediminivirga luteola]|uniref:Uncharacterized protein n=1 Tax=Sediminivirga luteola TaxID=1774748 RepID=A0A8J2TXQ0_9MICO|nr:hypothetical protein [Sediminivirga luteola]MCI2266582.1 hypothetical protein [Sediminivirga luteola]GGA12876.1 hypothetical protein GCM10011333_14720 [Sediminivirga luteola]